MRIVGYCRVSTADQAAEGVSLDAQTARIAAWCEARGARLDPAEDLFTDAGLSGKRADNRPGLRDALDAVCEHAGILVVYSLSRLARSVRDTLRIADELEKSGADLVSLSESIDTTSATGKMIFRLLAVLAEFERDLLSERTRAALRHKRSKGERIGQVPYGFALSGDGIHLDRDVRGEESIGLARALDAEGLSLRRIARMLDDRGFPTKSGRPWAPSTVARLIRRDPAHAAVAPPLVRPRPRPPLAGEPAPPDDRVPGPDLS